MARAATILIAGHRNGGSASGLVLRKTITPTVATRKASSVPTLHISATTVQIMVAEIGEVYYYNA
ncbi:hypothetical protein SPACI_038030 [Sporomusa acidovorans DSM 3132]|uniref:Uncharacterized protein n=1 Tax=Sporomusa acidovorans (strain ATCC 49682 / DSM 3132 / Mol) TaxID=1123286 RepID=A0ABZ3J6I1_SPOA4|nr:hypothetical protein [Sporomusa acidovorans]OZC19697.1 hypothetical protein SPACI_28170 [Sporomusa acidovorans DSM 3132]SDF72163.1 hypothetical protein SAMN04488499_10722 [Sporomusa acidovorans]